MENTLVNKCSSFAQLIQRYTAVTNRSATRPLCALLSSCTQDVVIEGGFGRKLSRAQQQQQPFLNILYSNYLCRLNSAIACLQISAFPVCFQRNWAKVLAASIPPRLDQNVLSPMLCCSTMWHVWHKGTHQQSEGLSPAPPSVWYRICAGCMVFRQLVSHPLHGSVFKKSVCLGCFPILVGLKNISLHQQAKAAARGLSVFFCDLCKSCSDRNIQGVGKGFKLYWLGHVKKSLG